MAKRKVRDNELSEQAPKRNREDLEVDVEADNEAEVEVEVELDTANHQNENHHLHVHEQDDRLSSPGSMSSASSSVAASRSPSPPPSPPIKNPLKFSIESIMRSPVTTTTTTAANINTPQTNLQQQQQQRQFQSSMLINQADHLKGSLTNQINQHNNSSKTKIHNSHSNHRTGHTKQTGSPAGNCQQVAPELAPFECHLDNKEIWDRFHPLGTEMIITKQGRRMFPPVRVNFTFNELQSAGQTNRQGALNGRDKFQVLMDILPYDKKRYRYAYHKSSWQQAGKADPPSPPRLFLHPDGPFTLDQLRRQVISFEKIKLTNNDANKHGYIVLNSMHKYQPRIHLVLWRGKEQSCQSLANAPIAALEQETIHKTFIFQETIFTAVTAYQNHSITKLKIDSNPFAKGFRDSSRLTDFELESMQDLMSDGGCPFSPPRAPPPGFPHFLFAQPPSDSPLMSMGGQGGGGGGCGPGLGMGGAGPPGNQQKLSPEEATSALLRERTIMALDSFLQQQQQQQQHHLHHQQQQQSGSPQQPPPLATGQPASSSPPSSCPPGASPVGSGPNSRTTPTSSACQPTPIHKSHFQPGPPSFGQGAPGLAGLPLAPPPPPPTGGYQPPVSSQQQQQPPAASIEQFILQQQQHFAAAMAAAAAFSGTGHHHHGHLPHPLHSLFAQMSAGGLGGPGGGAGGPNGAGGGPPLG